MLKKQTKLYSALMILPMLLSFGLVASAQRLDTLDEGDNIVKTYSSDITLSDTPASGEAWVTWDDSFHTISIDTGEDFTTTLKAISEDGYAATVTSWSGITNFTGNKVVIEADSLYGYSYGVSLFYGGAVNFNNKETVIKAKSTEGFSYGIYTSSDLNEWPYASSVSFATSNIDIISQSIYGDAYGAFASSNANMLFGTGALNIEATGGNRSWGLEAQSNSVITLDNSTVGITSKSTGDSAIGIRADTSQVSFNNPAAVVNISASVTGNGSAFGISTQNTVGSINFKNVNTTIEAISETGEAQGVEAAFGTVSFSNTSNNSVATITATSTNNIAFGVNAQNASTVNFSNKTVNITANGKQESYALYNSGSVINLNASDTVKLVGDIYADYEGVINVNIIGANSYLRGLMGEDNSGTINMTLANSGTWQPTKNLNSVNQAHLTIDGGIVDLAWWNNRTGNNPARNYRTITLDTNPVTITKNGLTLIVNSNVRCNTADKLVIEELSADSAKKFDLYIQLGYDPILRDYTNDSEPILITSMPWTPVFEVLDSNGNVRVNAIGLENTINEGIYLFKVTPHVSTEYGDNGKITSYISYEIDPDIFEPGIHKSLTWAFRTTHDNLWNRVGDIRREPEHLENGGAWARFYHSEMDIDNNNGANFNQKYNGIEVGVDNVKFHDDGNFYYGILGNYLNTTEKYELGRGQISNLHAGLYVTKIYNDGQYYDFVGRIGNYRGQYSIDVAPCDIISAKINTWMGSISGEYGFRSDLNSDSYVEPQFQIIAGRIGKFDNVTNNGLVAEYDNNDSLIARFGLNFAKEINDNKIYLTGSVLHDFGKTPTVTINDGHNTEIIKADTINTWFKAAVGANLKMAENGNAYIEISRLFADRINDNMKFIVGARFVF